jgi:hypothetical protein
VALTPRLSPAPVNFVTIQQQPERGFGMTQGATALPDDMNGLHMVRPSWLLAGLTAINVTCSCCSLRCCPPNPWQDDMKDILGHDASTIDEFEDHEEAKGNGGYSFDTPEHQAALKAQRAQLWQCKQGAASGVGCLFVLPCLSGMVQAMLAS